MMNNEGENLVTTGYRAALLILFALSGFAGLVYESLWTQYLKLFLGHAAYAQILVLAIFMGGLAAGAWLAGKWSEKIKNPLAAYAVAELALGAAAMLWHSEFTHAISWAFDSLLPALPSPAMAGTAQFVLSAALILPQTVVLGATFPLISTALLRAFPRSAGHSLAMLYFTNSIGGVAGMIASGFVLIPSLGLPGAMLVAAMFNIVAGLAAWLLCRGRELPPLVAANIGIGSGVPRLKTIILAAAFLTGASSFMYEVGWIRMLSLVLGASTHAFELMVSAFILGLALGGLWVKKRIDASSDKVAFAGYVQLAMGLLALATLPVFANSFDVMAFFIRWLPKTDGGYAAFNIVSHLIAASVMVPAAFCAGMTLPLFTAILISTGGEKSVGEVYAFNTAGAIAGVAFAIAIGMPILGLKGLCIAGAVVDALLGLFLLRYAGFARNGGLVAVAFAATAALVVIAVPFKPETLASGVFRTKVSVLDANKTVQFHKDGRTATITLVRSPNDVLSLITNGKVDASISLRPHSVADDEPTQTLLGALPLLINPGLKTAVSIGMGSGFSSRVLLASPSVQNVDTVEIEPMVVEAARQFGAANEKLFSDPRSHIHINDGKTFFAVRHRQYDLVISEPSNPWVSGVSGLFSKEFYSLVSRNLADGGLCVQWLQLYETNMQMFASVINAMDESFEDWAVYAVGPDAVIVGRKGAKLPPPALGAASQELTGLLARVGVRTADDLRLLGMGNKKILAPLFRKTGVHPNSDYYPYLDTNAVKARFTSTSFQQFFDLRLSALPVLEMLDKEAAPRDHVTAVTSSPFYEQHNRAVMAQKIRDYFVHDVPLPDDMNEYVMMAASALKKPGECGKEHAVALRIVTNLIVAHLSPDELKSIWPVMIGSCRETDWDRLIKAISTRDGTAMADAAERLLAGRDSVFDIKLKKFVLESAMLGYLASGNKQAALEVCNKYFLAVFADKQPDFILDFLYSLANTDPAIRR
jgi:predicted membrane-bound spermidine synthase